MRKIAILSLCASFSFAVGCRTNFASECEPGTQGCACYDNNSCNEGLVCTQDVCLEEQQGEESGDTQASSSEASSGDSSSGDGDESTTETTGDTTTTGDGDGDTTTETTGDGDGDTTETTGDGDGDTTTETTGDGDGDNPLAGEFGQDCVTGLDGGVCFGGWVCLGDDTCGACAANEDCANNLCNTDSGRCDPEGLCVLDSECPDNSYCDNDECVFAHPAQGICNIDKIYYSFDSFQVPSLYAQRLSDAASCIAGEVQGGATLNLQVHTDIVGTSVYNLALAENRGNAVKSYLGSLGVPASGVTVTSYGSMQASGILEADRAEERRIDFVWQ